MNQYRKALLLISGLCLCFGSALWAQQPPENDHAPAKIVPIQQPYAKFAIGIFGGVTIPYMDLDGTKTGPVFGGRLSYQPTTFLQLTGDLQHGKLKGSTKNNESVKRSFVNSYYYGAITGNIYPFKIRKYPTSPLPDFLDYLYVGAGVALIKNRGHWRRERKTGVEQTPLSGTAFLIPVNVGAEIPVWKPSGGKTSLLTLTANYRQHFSFSDELDGINPHIPANKKNDVYSQLTLGISFHF